MQQTICLISVLCKVLLLLWSQTMGRKWARKGSMQIISSSFPSFYTSILNHEVQPATGCGRMIRGDAQALCWQGRPRCEKNGRGIHWYIESRSPWPIFNEPVHQSTCLMKHKLSHSTFDVHDYVILLNLWLQHDVSWISTILNNTQSWIWKNPQN